MLNKLKLNAKNIRQTLNCRHYYKDKTLTHIDYELLINNRHICICNVPSDKITIKIFELCNKNKCNLSCIKFKRITQNLCNIAAEYDYMNIYHIPEKYLTEKICKLGIKHGVFDLYDIPKKFHTKEICEIAKR